MDASRTTQLSFLPTLLLLSFLIPTSSSSQSLATSVRCNPNDYTTLMKIKAALNNPYHLASWVSTTDCCDWNDVECNSTTNRITQLTISGSICGQIPAEVGDLPYLNYLLFRHNTNLTGTIPSTIAKLKLLMILDLRWNSLSGPIPSFLNQLPNLYYLDLSLNQFSGSIPSSLSFLPKLTVLLLCHNRLTGTIPESFGKFKQPLNLYLFQNQLSGEIPKSLGDANFLTIDLSRNKLQGDASMLFKANGSNYIDLSRNMFVFNLSKVGLAKNMVWLDISHNKIIGSIPEGITGLNNLQHLNVSYNGLCGKIPQGGEVQNFDSYSFYHNKCLCGSPLAACK